MQHDFSLVFETDNEYWQRVLDIFAKSESYPKKVVSKRNLHHKFPRSFSKLLKEPVDNDKDNLISLSLADHFLVHYYYYLLAKKGFRQSMATAFTFMAKKCLKYVTPETAEAMAKDYAEAQAIANQYRSEISTGELNHMYGKHFHHTDEAKIKISEKGKGRKHTDEAKAKMRGRYVSEETRKKISESKKGNSWNKGKHLSEETKQKLREAHARRNEMKKENKT